MKKFIVYFPFPLPSTASGSGVRPKKLLEAFDKFAVQHNFECIVITGIASERASALKKLYREVDPKEILFCYMENQTTPIWLTDPNHLPMHPFMDYNFFRYLRKNNIPLGVFYRDIYWKFNHLYTVGNVLVKKILIKLFKWELQMYKKSAKKIFLPSSAMNKYVGADKTQVIPSPPGGIDYTELTHNKDEVVNAIYVGGISPRYGIYDVLEALHLLNVNQVKIRLQLVCREKEFLLYKERFEPYLGKSWLNVIHASGDQLIPFYKKADFGIVTLQNNVYNDFAVPVKLFEYLSFGLPVIASNTTAMKEIVEAGSFGLIVNDTMEEIKNGFTLLLDQSIREKYRENAIHALKTEHLWIHRVEEIYHSLVD